MEILEPLTWQSKIVNLQRQIISLKIKFYRMHKDNDAYLEAAGQYYELSEIMEKEKQAMIANMLDVRESLERANKKTRDGRSKYTASGKVRDGCTDAPGKPVPP